MATKRLSAGMPKSSVASDIDSRTLMRQTAIQKKIAGVKRVEHPLARYNKLDQLSCALCLLPLKNEASWNAHLLSKTHKDNVEKLKRGESVVEPVKKKSAATLVQSYDSDDEDMDQDQQEVSNDTEEPPAKLSKAATGEPVAPTSSSALPSDFFDSGSDQQPSTIPTPAAPTSNDAKEPTSAKSALPVGFFDDAYKDAKARNAKKEDKFEDVWQDFQREIAKEAMVSREIADEDEEKMYGMRNVDEIDEEMERWNRIEALHNKHDAIKASISTKMDTSDEAKHGPSKGTDDSSGSEEEFSLDDALNWRKKKI